MNLRALRTLVEIDETGGFAAVADRLGLSLSAVSAQMKTLELELGLALFDRAYRPPQLTPLGRAAASRARRILAEADGLRAAAAASGGAVVGRFRFGFVLTASVRRLPAFLARAAAAHPEAEIEVASGLSDALLRDVATGRLDAAAATLPPDLDPSLAVEILAHETLALVRPLGAAAETLAELAQRSRFIRFAPATGIGLLITRRFAEDGIAPARSIVLDTMEAVMECVNAGVGFTILPEPDARRYAAPEVTIGALEGPPLQRALGVVWRRDGPQASALRRLIALV